MIVEKLLGGGQDPALRFFLIPGFAARQQGPGVRSQDALGIPGLSRHYSAPLTDPSSSPALP